MTKYTLLICILLSTLTFAKGDAQYLIKEMEALRDSLELDDPARVDLTLRLADLYFDVSIMEGKSKGEEEDHKLLKKNRLKALDLYKHTLNGTDGIKKAKGLRRVKIEFQMARLLSRLNEYEQAEAHYLNVLAFDESPKKMREQSALGLAEWFEEDAQYIKALKYYDLALSLSETKTMNNYVHYRKGWLYYKDTKLDLAVQEMKASLIDAKGSIRENSLTDLMLFMSNQEGDGKEALAYIKKLASDHKRPELVRSLVEAYYVAGNRFAGSHLLADLNKTSGNLYYEVRLLEEFYGFRKWDEVSSYLSQIEKRKPQDIPRKEVEAKEVLKTLRRFIVQVDAETQVIEELNVFLKRSIAIYLTLYPNDELRKKMQQGWLKAEADSKLKVAKLGQWIKEDIGFGKKNDHIRNLRQTRLSMAQKLKMQDIVLEDALAISDILKGQKEADEFTYVAARELYREKKYEKALPLFLSLVDQAMETKSFSKWSILAQNLSLDIYNTQKDFSAITKRVTAWQMATKETTNKDVLKEQGSMNKILVEAKFEEARKMGETPEALERFFSFCFSDIFPKKSCSNAKVLAVKLKDQDKVVRLLERAKDEKALVTEYELMGRFTEAAKLNEKFLFKGKNSKDVPVTDYLKIALLYELDQDFKNRDRILNKLVRKVKKEGRIEDKFEKAIFLTLDEAKMITTKSLTLPWSLKTKLRLSHRLQIENPSKQSRKLLLSQKESQGPAWSKLVLGKLEKPFARSGKISFYGRYSQSRFKKRTRAIDRFVKKGKEYLDGADLETRVYILHMLSRVYKKMTNDIYGTPLPEGLDEETMKMVQVKLKTMAEPFEKVAMDYDRLLGEQLTALTEEDRGRVAKNLEQQDILKYADFIQVRKQERLNVASVDYGETVKWRAVLQKSPENAEALKALRDFYKEKSSARMAAYYTGRVNSLSTQEGKVL